MENKEIPIIEVVPEKKGYWKIYPDKKIWHNEKNYWDSKMKFAEYEKAEKEYGVGGGKWMNLQEGDNKIRIVSEFEDYGQHYNQATNKSVVCLGKEKCPICRMGDKARVQYLGWVIDRSDGRIKLLRIGHQIFKQIGELSRNEEYYFDIVPDYDITIKRVGQGLETEYTVIPARQNTPLTEDEKKQIEEIVKDPKQIIEGMKTKTENGLKEAKEEEEEIPF